MNQAKLETTVGLFVLAGLVAVAWLALKIGGGTMTGIDTYLVHATFSNVSGVNPGSNILIAGVTVGRVKGVRLDFENFRAVVDLEVRKDVKLPMDSIVSVRTSGLIGDKFLAIQPGGDAELVTEGGTLTETEPTVDLESLISRFAFGDVKKKEPAP